MSHSKGENKINTYRKTAVLVGIFFIIGTVAGVLSMVFLGSFLEDSAYLANIAANENNIILGALFILTMSFALTKGTITIRENGKRS